MNNQYTPRISFHQMQNNHVIINFLAVFFVCFCFLFSFVVETIKDLSKQVMFPVCIG